MWLKSIAFGLNPSFDASAKPAVQKQIKNVEAQRNDKRRPLFEAQDAIDQQREDLIGKIESKLQQAVTSSCLFALRWILL